MSLLNCVIYQRGRVFRVVDTELVLVIAYLVLVIASDYYVQFLVKDDLGAIEQTTKVSY